MLIDSKKRCTKTSLGLCGHGMHSAVASGPNNNCGPPPPNFPNFVPHLHMYNNSVRVHPYAHPQHTMVLKHSIKINMDVGWIQQWSTASLNNHNAQHHLWSNSPHFSKFCPPPTLVYWQSCKGAPICPSTACDGAQLEPRYTLYIRYGCGMDSAVTVVYGLTTITPKHHLWSS